MTKLKAFVYPNKQFWEASVVIPGLEETRLMRLDGSYSFRNKGAILQALKSLATRLNCNLLLMNETTMKQAAKKSVK